MFERIEPAHDISSAWSNLAPPLAKRHVDHLCQVQATRVLAQLVGINADFADAWFVQPPGAQAQMTQSIEEALRLAYDMVVQILQK